MLDGVAARLILRRDSSEPLALVEVKSGFRRDPIVASTDQRSGWSLVIAMARHGWHGPASHRLRRGSR